MVRSGMKLDPPWRMGTHRFIHFDISPSDVIDPPPEVVAQGLDAVKTHIRQSLEEGKDFLTEAKLLILGEAGAGKTTLARKLVDPSAAMPGDHESTEGIDVGRWTLEGVIAAHGRMETRPVDINVWDFGGQEIYHATHQFFLSRRSVYVIVADCRKEDTDFNYWLRAVELFGQGSPVIIILNERNGRRRQIDLKRLQARFPDLADAIPADLSSRQDVSRVRREIQRRLLALPHLSDMLPRTWRSVRDELETLRSGGRDYLSLKAYLDVCSSHGFDSTREKLILAQFLHDIGICLHFQKVPQLRETVILEPEWGTDAVYRVLDHKPIQEQFGRFTFDDLHRIWSAPRYNHKHAELLSLMGEFELCYPLPSGSAHIAPQLLSVRQPSYKLSSASQLSIFYKYDFMPKGIVTRFIVAVHDLIHSQKLVWRNGVVLRWRGATAEVVEDYPARTISVRVVGEERQGLTGIIDHHIERIHRRFERNLKYKTLIPCQCSRCMEQTTAGLAPFFYPHARLAHYAANRRFVVCDVSFEEVDPGRLLALILPERVKGDRVG